MNALKKTIDKKSLRNFFPLDKLSIDKLNELLDKSNVEEIPAGRILFRQGEKDKRNFYLLEGQVELQITGNTKPEVVKAKTLEAKYPLADSLPRPSTCRARTGVTMLVVDADHLEILLEHDPSGTYEVTELGMDDENEDSTDWMLRFLQSRAFLQLPTDNIQGLLMRLEERQVKRGEVIIQQGSQDEFYYIVKQGKCSVSRRPAPKAEDIRLAILSVGDGFGEEALITNGKRNATVTMQEDGVVMQLHKKDFLELLVEPLISKIELSAATSQAKKHTTLIDVRTNKAFTENGLENATNIPLSMLRVKLGSLNPTTDYIVYCDDGNQSAAAAFLMIQQGLNCQVIRNGIAGKTAVKNVQVEAKQPTENNVVKMNKETPKTTATRPATPSAPAKTKAEPAPEQAKFEAHRRQAQEEARKAKMAEDARQAAENKTQQLKDKADKLRLEAERLAMKTASAESARKQAEEELGRIKSDADGVRKQAAKESQKMRKEAEQLRQQAEQELSKIKQEAASIQSQQDAIEKAAREAAQQAEQKTREAEQAQRQAKAEAERVRAEAESIRQSAMQEAERLKQEMNQARKNAAKLEAEEAARREAELIAAKQRAELAIQQAAQAVEDAKNQAALEAEAIRQKAYEEAERTRREAEAAAEIAAKRADEQQREQQQRLDEARRQAEAKLKETSEAAEQARRQAELEAEKIRQEAIQEAEQLRRDMESTRKLVEEEAARAKAKITEDSQRQIEAEQKRRELEAQQKAAEEAARLEAQKKAEEEAARLEAEAQQQAAAEAARLEQLALQEKAEKTRQLAENKKHDENHARELAEAIMQKLSEAENARKTEQPDAREGLHIAKASIRRVKDRTILEGDEDIFIFKEPKAHDIADDDHLFDDEQPQKKNKASTANKEPQDDDELPSFIVEPKTAAMSDNSVMPEVKINQAGFTAQANTAETKNSRKQIYALAASVALMIGIGIFSFNSKTPNPLEKLATVSQPAKASATAAENINTNNMASFAADTSKNKKKAEQKSESKVKNLLSRWKKQLLDNPKE